MASSDVADDLLSSRFPRVSPILHDIERAFVSIEAFNGGHGTITIHIKDGQVPTIDVLMRYFLKEKPIRNTRNKSIDLQR